MLNSSLRNILDNAKNSLSCRDFLNLKTPNGHTIRAPKFIRDDNNPSFSVWDNGCKDWSTGTYYDIFSLKMLRDNQSLPEAFRDLTGHDLFPQHDHQSQQQIDELSQAKSQLLNDCNQWHKNLLADPIINYKGKDVHLLSEYLKGRGISPETAESMLIGFNPKTMRLIFPCFVGKEIVYYIGRDLTGKCEAQYKYVKAKIDSSIALRSTFWGRETLRKPQTSYTKNFTDTNGESFQIEDNDPRNYTLIVCEGILDYASFRQDGWQVLSPGTIYFSRYDIREFLDFAKSYRNVCICFDNDKRGQDAAISLAKILFANRIHFSIAHTHNPDGSAAKFDVNDYYSHGGSLEELVKNSANGLSELADTFDTEDEVSDFLESASRFAKASDMVHIMDALIRRVKPNPDYNPGDETSDQFIPMFSPRAIKYLFKDAMKPTPELQLAKEVSDSHHIKYNYDDGFYVFEAGRWQRCPEAKLIGFILDVMGTKRATNGRARAVMRDLMSTNGEFCAFDQQNIFVFKNGVLDLETGTFYKHSPSFMNTIMVDYYYKSTALAPKWAKFIHEVSKGNPKLMRQLQKAAGYVLFADNRLQKMFALYGTGANGKSVYTTVIEQVFGSQNTSNVRPDRLSSEFDPVHLKGKLVNICYEAKRNLNGAEETLKAVVSGDPIMAAHKGIDAETFTSRAKWFINLNDVMETTDISWGFLRRLIFLPFDASFNGDAANTHLTEELLEELPGIFNWCYEGYKMLREDMSFETLERSTELMEQMTARVNNSFSFFCDSFRYDANDYLQASETNYYPTSNDIYDYYKSWCVENNEKPETKKMFLERFRVFIEKYRPDVVISAPYRQTGIRGQIVKFYFPEIVCSMEPDYFADDRDESGKVVHQGEDVNVNTQELAEEMQSIDAGLSTVKLSSEELDYMLLHKGEQVFNRYVVDPRWVDHIDDIMELPLLGRYLKANPNKRYEMYKWADAVKVYPILALIAKGEKNS